MIADCQPTRLLPQFLPGWTPVPRKETMVEILKKKLVDLKWFPTCMGNTFGWQVRLSSPSWKTQVNVSGDTLEKALLLADQERQEIEKDPQYKQPQ